MAERLPHICEDSIDQFGELTFAVSEFSTALRKLEQAIKTIHSLHLERPSAEYERLDNLRKEMSEVLRWAVGMRLDRRESIAEELARHSKRSER